MSYLIIYIKSNIPFIYNLTTVSKISNEHISLLPKVWLKIIVLRRIFHCYGDFGVFVRVKGWRGGWSSYFVLVDCVSVECVYFYPGGLMIFNGIRKNRKTKNKFIMNNFLCYKYSNNKLNSK